MKSHIHIITVVSLFLSACGGGENSTPPIPRETGNFPVGLAVASPFDILENGEVIDDRIMDRRLSYYNYSRIDIEHALDGDIPVRFAFKPGAMFETVSNESCFAPATRYQNHPHDTLSGSAEIPAGELGIWLENSETNSNICSAEILNRGVQVLSRQYRTTQMMFASMIYLVESAITLELPTIGNTLDITSELNTRAGSFEDDNSVFNSATITHQDDGSWRYHIDLDIERSWGLSGIYIHNMQLYLDHSAIPEDHNNQYSGLLRYRISGSDVQFPGTNCADTANRTFNGSIKYQRHSANQIVLQARSATFCGENVDGHIISIGEENGMVDDDFPYNGSNQGWSEDFKIFVADFDPITEAGNYSYVSQMNPDDNYSRILNVGVTTGEGSMQAESYFGFGDSLAGTDGNIHRFVCNLSGPNGGLSLMDRSHIDRVQRQQFSLIGTSSLFGSSGDGSSILYAPTNDCSYDGSAPNGEFLYDRDSDGLISDETHQAVTHQLWQGTEKNQLDGDTLPEIIIQRGTTTPSPPGGWPASN